MWVVLQVLGFEVVKVAAQHHDELRGILEQVDADERRVVLCIHLTKGAVLYGPGSFKVPPELGLWELPARRGEAGIAPRSPDGHAQD
jgi:hypothetical protein